MRSPKRPNHETPRRAAVTRAAKGRVLVQTEFPVAREHAGRKSTRRIARLWVKP